MTFLDNKVLTVALPAIRSDVGATSQSPTPENLQTIEELWRNYDTEHPPVLAW